MLVFVAWVVVLLLILLTGLLILGKLRKRSYVVLVLGEIGHSPRMQYHALSLANELGEDVDFIGYPGAQPTAAVREHAKIHLRHIQPFRSPFPVPYPIYAALKIVTESLQIAMFLLVTTNPRAILVQNPPAIPTLFWAVLASYIKWAPLIIDFHNFGYTMLALKLKDTHPFVKLSYQYEAFLSRFASRSLCVTKAMRDWLGENWKVSANVLYDRPAAIFQPLSIEDQHSLWQRLDDQGVLDELRDWGSPAKLFTSATKERSASRPWVFVSSTSWSPDEDFGMLLDAFPRIDQHLREQASRAVFIITGKGPLRDQFVKRVKSMELLAIKVFTAWLEIGDYPKLLACADVGLSFHRSSSGLDLPMKVVDMFGVNLPVLAVKFRALPELVRHDVNGLVFLDADELVNNIQIILANPKKLEDMRKEIDKFRSVGWEQQWRSVAKPVFQ